MSMKAVLVPPETPVFEGITDKDAGFVTPMTIDRDADEKSSDDDAAEVEPENGVDPQDSRKDAE